MRQAKARWLARSSSTLVASQNRANSASASSGRTMSSFSLKALVRAAMAPSFLRSAQNRFASALSLASNRNVLPCRASRARMASQSFGAARPTLEGGH